MKRKNEQSTRELMGTKELSDYSIRTYRKDELVYFLIQPSNLSVLSEESLSARIYGLMTVLKGITEIEICFSQRSVSSFNISATICFISSLFNALNTIVSSIRFKNSGLKIRRTSSITLFFMRS